MSKIEKLIQEFCPNGVEYKVLSDICERIFAGGTPRTSNNEYFKGNIPWLRSGEINFNILNTTEKNISENGLKNSSAKWIRKNSVLLAMTGATVARSGVNSIPLTANQSVCALETNEEKINYKFLYYILSLNYDIIRSLGQGVLTSLNLQIVKSIQIPVPPLTVQQEIVSILDKFTTLEAELESELEVRRAQYKHYRDQLLCFEGKEVEWRLMGEVGEFIRGRRFVKDDIISEGVPCIHYGELYTHYNIWAKEAKSFLNADLAAKLRFARKNDVVIVSAGETIEDIGNGVAWLGDSDVVIHDACFAYRHSMNPKFVSYFLQTNLFRSQIKKYISSGKISSINSPGLSKAKIPIPPMEEQERIVKILDKFNALVNDISVGIPAEIKARRKQYEYYRGKLLDFKNISHATE